MKTKKRRKFSRMRGSFTHGRGGKKKARGSGHRGGIGRAGSGKRADQKKDMINMPFGKIRRRARKLVPKLKEMNLRDVQLKFKDKEINLKGYKILGVGEVTGKLKITASAASKSAIDKVKKAGGDIILE